MEHRPQLPVAYKVLVNAARPAVVWWGRLSASGVENIPESGPTLLCVNHESYWDPMAIALAAYDRRQLRALAKSSLWKGGPMSWALDNCGHIPIERGAGDRGALDRAVHELGGGAAIGIFIEGTRSLGRELRARSGFGYLAQAVPEAEIVCCRVNEADRIPRLDVRPSVTVEFFRPRGGGMQTGEGPQEFCQRLLDEIREGAPRAIAGRKRRKAAARGELPQ